MSRYDSITSYGLPGAGLACGRALTGPDGHGLAAAVQSRMAGANAARVMEGDGTIISVQQSREAFLKAQAKTCKLCIAPFATHPSGLNPLRSKSLFQPL
jgi:hypothetical protein